MDNKSTDELLDRCSISAKSLYNMTKKLEGIQLNNLFMTMPRQFGRTNFLQFVLYHETCYTYGKELVDKILEEQGCSVDEIHNYIIKVNNEYSYCDMRNLKPSIDTQITNLKSQLKHCKNPLQKLNMEREMNRLIREKGKEIEYV